MNENFKIIDDLPQKKEEPKKPPVKTIKDLPKWSIEPPLEINRGQK